MSCALDGKDHKFRAYFQIQLRIGCLDESNGYTEARRMYLHPKNPKLKVQGRLCTGDPDVSAYIIPVVVDGGTTIYVKHHFLPSFNSTKLPYSTTPILIIGLRRHNIEMNTGTGFAICDWESQGIPVSSSRFEPHMVCDALRGGNSPFAPGTFFVIRIARHKSGPLTVYTHAPREMNQSEALASALSYLSLFIS